MRISLGLGSDGGERSASPSQLLSSFESVALGAGVGSWRQAEAQMTVGPTRPPRCIEELRRDFEPAKKVLQCEIAPLLIRPVGRPPKGPVILYDDFWYRAGSWDCARRVVAKVEWHQGELFPRVGFIVTNMTAGPEGVVRFYNGRGTAEQWIKEGKYALNWTRLSCHRFVANRVRLSLFILAYNLGNFLRRLCLPKAVRHWSLRSVQVKLIKMGGRLVRHSRRLIFQLSEVSVPRRLFQGVLDRIGRLSPAPS